ncbi:MAG: DUF192 domain-containing protein [bacterium]|nr:DUF192 domain-containing protein [bacterium]
MKTIIGLFVVLFIVAFAVIFFQSKNPSFKSPFAKNPTVSINKHAFSVVIAKSAKETEIGLSEKTSLPQDSGMLFIFNNPDYYSFWMKNMKFSIDIIFINKDRVVAVFTDAPIPKSKDEYLPIYKPDEPADEVLEINAGLSKKYNIKKGDQVKFENI